MPKELILKITPEMIAKGIDRRARIALLELKRANKGKDAEISYRGGK